MSIRSRRSKYAITGLAIGLALDLCIFVFTGLHWKRDLGPFFATAPTVVMVVALWWGERKGRIPTREEEERPITLFGEKPSSKKD